MKKLNDLELQVAQRVADILDPLSPSERICVMAAAMLLCSRGDTPASVARKEALAKHVLQSLWGKE